MTFILRRAAWPAVAAAGVLTLAGCSQGEGGSGSSSGAGPSASTPAGDREHSSVPAADGDLAVPADVDAGTRKLYVEQNALAACMRAKGFTYTPHVRKTADPLAAVDGRDYEAAKKFRDKYGFGVYAGAVYRNDPNVWGSQAYNDKETNPDGAYLKALTPARLKSYYKALGGQVRAKNGMEMAPGCLKDARDKVYGPEKSQKEIQREAAEDKAQALAAQRALDGDPQLVALAHTYATCLTRQGIDVTTTQPTSIGDMVKFQVSGRTPPDGVLSMDKTRAAAKLTQEIGLAKKDLACGKEFRAAYFPKLARHPFDSVTG